MNFNDTQSRKFSAKPLLLCANLAAKMLIFANRHRATSNVLQAIETWIDDLDVETYRWVKRQYPEYELAFAEHVRGQEMRIHVDYNARSDFLGLFMYLPTPFPLEIHAAVCDQINKINVDMPYGNLELDRRVGLLRFRFSLDVEGIKLTHLFLDFMLGTGRRLFEQYIPELLARPKVADAPNCYENGLKSQATNI